MHLKADDSYLFATSSSDAQNSTVTSTCFPQGKQLFV